MLLEQYNLRIMNKKLKFSPTYNLSPFSSVHFTFVFQFERIALLLLLLC